MTRKKTCRIKPTQHIEMTNPRTGEVIRLRLRTVRKASGTAGSCEFLIETTDEMVIQKRKNSEGR